MRKQSARQRNGCFAFRGGTFANCKPVEDAAVEVNERFPRDAGRCSGCDCSRPGARIKADQNKPGDVSERPFVSFDLMSPVLPDVDSLRFAIAPASPKQPRGLGTGEPAVTRIALR